MVRRVASSGASVEVIVGKAGAGKTSALAAAAEAWRASGVPVLGTAVAARAALAFGEQAGVPAMTVTRLLAALDKPVGGRPAGLAPGTVLIVDEAGMLGTRTLARLLAHVQAADAKLVLVGDHRQLPELEAGGAFRSLAGTLGAVELTENRRQAEAWERDALDQLCDGNPIRALDDYEAAGRIQRADTDADARAALASSWWQASTDAGRDRPSPEVVMLAVRRTDVDELILRARTHMHAAGFLTGQRGTVTAVDPELGTLTVQVAEQELNLNAGYLRDGGLDHGYALTVHQSQGMTCEQAMLLGSDALYREAGYVGLSRGRQRNDLHLVERAAPDNPEQELCHAPRRSEDVNDVDAALTAVRDALGRSRAQSLAHDLGR